MLTNRGPMAVTLIAGVLLLAACTGGSETQLFPLERDGMFYTEFAQAQQQAIDEDKLILLEFWRPG